MSESQRGGSERVRQMGRGARMADLKVGDSCSRTFPLIEWSSNQLVEFFFSFFLKGEENISKQ